MQDASPQVTSAALPAHGRIAGFYATTHLADAYGVALPGAASRDPEQLARFLFAQQPAWIHQLMKVRDALVGGLGLKTASQLQRTESGAPSQRVGIFKIYERHPDEIILGEDDSHLDFRVSVLYTPAAMQVGSTPASSPRLTVTTVVHCHNLLGRVYIFVIAPFHRLVVRAGLKRASRLGWPAPAAQVSTLHKGA